MKKILFDIAGRIWTVLILIFVVIPLSILFSPVIALFGINHWLTRKKLMEEVRNVWLEQGRDILFVTSNSPVWAKHIDQEILPLIKNRAIVINWSERTKWEWDKSLEARVFKQWLGAGKYIFDGKIFWQGREFCPAAIIFKSHGKPTVIRFWQAYKDLKHGNFELFNQQISKLNKLLK